MEIEFGNYEHEGATLIPFEEISSLILPITQMRELNEAESDRKSTRLNSSH